MRNEPRSRRYVWEPGLTPEGAAAHVYAGCYHRLIVGATSAEALFIATGPLAERLFCPSCRAAGVER